MSKCGKLKNLLKVWSWLEGEQPLASLVHLSVVPINPFFKEYRTRSRWESDSDQPHLNSYFVYRNGTSMISLIIPPKDQISRVSKMLADEYGTASNIKSRVNRLSVLGAITSVQQRLKLYTKGKLFSFTDRLNISSNCCRITLFFFMMHRL